MIKGKNLYLRALEPSDIDLLYQWENDTAIWHISETLTPYSHYILEQYILNSHQDIFTTKQLRMMVSVIDEAEPQPAVGAIDLFDFNPHHRRAGIGILINKAYRQKGYATEALELLIDYSFNTLKMHQLYCNIDVENINSIKLFSNMNFEIIGVKKEWVFRDNRWIDEYMMQLINKL